MQATRGFSLIELMITLVIIAILAAVAIPGYRNYVMRTQRGDATAALLRIAAAQEKHYLQRNTYTTNLNDAPPDGLGIPMTENGWYTLGVDDVAPGGLTAGYQATATADAGGPQGGDDACQTFTINHQSVRDSAPDPVDVCWR